MDFIMQVPRNVAWAPDELVERSLVIKNVVMRMIVDIRERKKRPKLSDFMAVYRSKKNEPGAKESFQRKFKMLYSGEQIDNTIEDAKFRSLMSNFDRIQKQLTQQQ